MVSRKKCLTRLGMAEHELNAARFLVNLKPSVNSWPYQLVASFLHYIYLYIYNFLLVLYHL